MAEAELCKVGQLGNGGWMRSNVRRSDSVQSDRSWSETHWYGFWYRSLERRKLCEGYM